MSGHTGNLQFIKQEPLTSESDHETQGGVNTFPEFINIKEEFMEMGNNFDNCENSRTNSKFEFQDTRSVEENSMGMFEMSKVNAEIEPFQYPCNYPIEFVEVKNNFVPIPLPYERNETSSALNPLGKPTLEREKSPQGLTCHDCKLQFAFKFSLRYHLKNEHKENAKKVTYDTGRRYISCMECDTSFQQESMLRIHNSLMHRKQISMLKYKCDFCGVSSVDKKVLCAHITGLHLSIECTVCRKLFSTPRELEKHKTLHKRKNTKKKYVCISCKGTFYGAYRFNHHLTQNMKCKRGGTTCDTCGFKCRAIHQVAEHNPCSQKKNFKCEICDYQKNISEIAIKAHMNRHISRFKSAGCLRKGESMQQAHSRYLNSKMKLKGEQQQQQLEKRQKKIVGPHVRIASEGVATRSTHKYEAEGTSFYIPTKNIILSQESIKKPSLPSFKCRKCLKKFSSKPELEKHKTLYEEKIICSTCKEIFFGEYRFTYHLTKNHKCKQGSYYCKTCKFHCTAMHHLADHKNCFLENHACDICGVNNIPSKMEIRIHISSHLSGFESFAVMKKGESLQQSYLRYLSYTSGSKGVLQHSKQLVKASENPEENTKPSSSQYLPSTEKSLSANVDCSRVISPAPSDNPPTLTENQPKPGPNGPGKTLIIHYPFITLWKCYLCSAPAKDKSIIAAHYKDIHKMDIYNCATNSCSCFFLTEAELNAHNVNCKPIHICVVCGFRLSSQNELEIHVSRKHPQSCTRKEKEFANKNCADVRQILMKERGEKTHCLKCWTKYTTFEVRNNDLHKCPQFFCRICSKTFQSPSFLAAHEAIHSNNTSCQLCRIIFKSKAECERHSAIDHLDQTVKIPQHCPVCDFTVTERFHSIVSHMHSHVRNKKEHKYRCVICKTMFSMVGEALMHCEMHSKQDKKGKNKLLDLITPYHCKKCNIYFLTLAKLKCHKVQCN